MNNTKKSVSSWVIMALAVFGLLGWSLALNQGQVSAQSDTAVDGETLDDLYDAVFHRPADTDGRNFHIGRDLKDVLRDFRESHEQRYYGALFKAVKSYEEAQRAPGTLTDTEKQSHLDLIDSALSHLLAWVATLPDQESCRGTMDPDVARKAIQEAHDRLSAAGKVSAEQGLLNAARHIGMPSTIMVQRKCNLRPLPMVQ